MDNNANLLELIQTIQSKMQSENIQSGDTIKDNTDTSYVEAKENRESSLKNDRTSVQETSTIESLLSNSNVQNLIGSFLGNLNTSNTASTASSANNPSNLGNITSNVNDFTGNLNSNSTQNNINSNINSNSNKSNMDLSSILGNIDLSSLFKNNSANSPNSNINNFNSVNSVPNLDINTISRMQNVLSSLTKDDPRKNLLIALKPFLSPNRQEKIGEYITYLSIGSAIGIFNNRKGSE